MNRIHKIQRLAATYEGHEKNPFNFGCGLINGGLTKEAMNIVKDIFAFDYMGAAEFEWGAVPTALGKIFALAVENKLSSFQLPNKLYVICPTDIKSDLTEWLNAIYIDEYSVRLKETLGLKRSVEGSNIHGWLKIEADNYCEEPFMFFTSLSMYEKTCELLELKNETTIKYKEI